MMELKKKIKTDESPLSDSKPESKKPYAISNGVKSAARSVGEDFAIQAGAGLASIVTAALGTAGIRNRKAIRNSISNFPSNARNSLGTIRERFRGSSAYRPQVDVPPASVASSRRPSNAASQGPMEILSESIGMSPARAARPPRAASASPRDSEVFIRETESAVARRNRPRSDSISSNYNTGDVTEHFSNARTPAARKPPLNSEERSFCLDARLDASCRVSDGLEAMPPLAALDADPRRPRWISPPPPPGRGRGRLAAPPRW
jgi:hypothetical protein